MPAAGTAEAIAAEALAALDGARQVAPFSQRLQLSEAEAYAVTAALRRLRTARGETQIGRKIGFTNRGIWPEYGVYAPIWGDMYDTTVEDVTPGATGRISHLPEPRIEPEIVLGIEGAPRPGMSLEAIFDQVGWIAHGFEIVQSIYPGWRFTWTDCVADNGLHGRLFVGPRRRIDGERPALLKALSEFHIRLSCDGGEVDRGRGANVLDGPVQALRHLLDVLERDTLNPSLRGGELVTTGTLTRAFPVAAGQTWSTAIEGIDLPGLSVSLA